MKPSRGPLATRVAALIRAGDMVAAIVISGIAVLALLWIGPGACAVDR